MTIRHLLVKSWFSGAKDLPVVLDDGQDPPFLTAPWFASSAIRTALLDCPEACAARLEIAGIGLDLEIHQKTEILRRTGGEPVPFSCAWSPADGLLRIETAALDTRAVFEHVQTNFGEDYIADDSKFHRHARRAAEVTLSGLRFRAEFRMTTFGYSVSLWPLEAAR